MSLINQIIGGSYEIQRVVGEGAFGTVYAARHTRLMKSFAVKVLRGRDPQAFARFRREAEITSQLGSRYIAQVVDYNTLEDGAPYLVMELLLGEDLGARLKARGRLPLSETLRICEQVAAALSVAHNHGVVHRDLKPQNIFLCKTEDEGEVCKVIDFGISKVSDAKATTDGQFLGTPVYMSPEQARGKHDLVDARTDVYALGAVLYESLGGKAIYDADNIFELLDKINGPELPPLLSATDSTISLEIDQVLRGALAKKRDERPRSPSELYQQFARAARSGASVEASTPAAPILGGTQGVGGTLYVTGMVSTPLWRGRAGKDDEIRFVAPEGGFAGGDYRPRSLVLGPGQTEWNVGSVKVFEGKPNDCELPHNKVSRSSLIVSQRNGRVYVKRSPRCSVPVRVGMSILGTGEERPVHHGQAIAVGVVAGVFLDGRYVPAQVPAQTVDEQTGLLGREGLAWEVALAARIGDALRLVVGQPLGESADEAVAIKAALALHALGPTWAVARFGIYVAALVKPDVELAPLLETAARAAGMPVLLGYSDLRGSSDEAGVRIDEARGALARLATSGHAQSVVDIAQHLLPVRDVDRFIPEARAITRAGGQAALLALEEIEQLRQMGPGVCGALELELLQVVGRIGGAGTILARPAPGTVAFASPRPAEPIATEVAAEWHARGPVRGEVLEVERSASWDVVGEGDLDDLAKRAMDLASGAGMGGVEGLPNPIATRARAVKAAATPRDRALAFVDLVDASWRFLAVTLGSIAMASKAPSPAPGETEWPTPWRADALGFARQLAGLTGRVGELVTALFGSDGKSVRGLASATEVALQIRGKLTTAALDAGGAKLLGQIDHAAAELLGALRPLRGWTLVAVERVEREDVLGECETIEYLDFTGTFERGTPRRVTLVKDLRMGSFVYLTRFAEGIVVPLEPLVRRRPCPICGAEELFWASSIVAAAGRYRYASMSLGHELEDEVTAKQLPRGVRPK